LSQFFHPLPLFQKEVAAKAGVHLQSIGKVERGKTAKLNHKTKNGLAYLCSGCACRVSRGSVQGHSSGGNGCVEILSQLLGAGNGS